MKQLSVHASFFVLLACLSSVMSEEGCLALCVRFRVSLVALSGTLKLVDVHTSVIKKWKGRLAGQRSSSCHLNVRCEKTPSLASSSSFCGTIGCTYHMLWQAGPICSLYYKLSFIGPGGYMVSTKRVNTKYNYDWFPPRLYFICVQWWLNRIV